MPRPNNPLHALNFTFDLAGNSRPIATCNHCGQTRVKDKQRQDEHLRRCTEYQKEHVQEELSQTAPPDRSTPQESNANVPRLLNSTVNQGLVSPPTSTPDLTASTPAVTRGIKRTAATAGVNQSDRAKDRTIEALLREIKALRQERQAPLVDINPISQAVRTLREDYQNRMSVDNMLEAISVLKDETNARIFLQLNGDLRDRWLAKEARIQLSQSPAGLPPQIQNMSAQQPRTEQNHSQVNIGFNAWHSKPGLEFEP